MEIFDKILYVVIVLTSVIGFLMLFGMYSEWRHSKIEEASQSYEDCVIAEYGIHPAAWHAQHGEYPFCDPNVHGE